MLNTQLNETGTMFLLPHVSATVRLLSVKIAVQQWRDAKFLQNCTRSECLLCKHVDTLRAAEDSKQCNLVCLHYD